LHHSDRLLGSAKLFVEQYEALVVPGAGSLELVCELLLPHREMVDALAQCRDVLVPFADDSGRIVKRLLVGLAHCIQANGAAQPSDDVLRLSSI
jgi:hypothetical protein